MKLQDFNLRDFGHSIQIVGVVFGSAAESFTAALPNEAVPVEAMRSLELSTEDWEAVLYQTDVLDVEMIGPLKAVVRKSQRQIDTAISWDVFKRDGYRCRYCGSDGALTVDHVDLWEAGGASVRANLVSSCKNCNRTRGRMEYAEWLDSADYQKRSKNLDTLTQIANRMLIDELPKLRLLRTEKQRSR